MTAGRPYFDELSTNGEGHGRLGLAKREERTSMIKKGMIRAFDGVTHTAAVQIAGSLSVWLEGVPVSRGIPAGEMVVGRPCAVLFLDESNPDDAVIVAVTGSGESGAGRDLSLRHTLLDNRYYPSLLVPWLYSTDSHTLSNYVLFAIPFPIPQQWQVDRIGVHIPVASATAGAKGRLGIYADKGDCYPGQLLVDAGEIEVDTTGAKSLAIQETLPAGLWWLAIHLGAADAHVWYYSTFGQTVLGNSAPSNITYGEYWVLREYQPLPDLFPSGAGGQYYIEAVMLRKAA